MVGRRSCPGNKKSAVAAEPALASRPKRNISPKSYDITAGLSWKEERELKKALYASLQESKRASTPKPDTEDGDTASDTGFRPIKTKQSVARMTRSSRSSSVPSTQLTGGQSVSNVDETSQESTISSSNSTSTSDSKKTKVRAQRKFAMNQPNTNASSTETSSSATLKASEKTSSSTIVFPKRAKTEDFLTFLCLRGTPLLPPHLDFFNYSRYDNRCSNGRDSSPSSSSTSISNGPEEQAFTPVNKFTTPCKKAARASAGTPETCRGLAGVKRLDKTPKTKSPLARRGRPARSLIITPVKASPSKDNLPSKITSRKLGKKGMGKDRLASKRKAVATLTHRASPVKLKKSDPEEPNKTEKPSKCALPLSQEISKRRPLRPRVNKMMTRPNDYIAMRLPRRQAKQNALKFYMEDLDVEERSNSDEEVTFPHKRKLKNFISENNAFPIKESRIRKINKNAQKSVTHGRQLLRNRLRFDKNLSNPERRTTRFSSKSSDSNSNESSDLVKKNVNQDIVSTNIKNNNDKNPTSVPERRPTRQRVTRMSESQSNITVESLPEQPKTRKNSVGGMTLRLRDPESPVKSLPQSPRRLDTPQSPRDISTSLTEIPTFCPTEEEFQRPLQYIQSIAPRAEPYGMCKIIPPSSWKMEGKISDDVRFTSQKQYTHKLYQRFGPNVEKLECIRKHLETLNPIEQIQIPEIGGVELDICDLDRMIKELGGMRNEVEKKKWARVADAINIPKMAQDRGTKLYDAYCKFLLSYNDLSTEEKSKVEGQVKAERLKVKREDQEEDCIVKGKNMSLGRFIQMARNSASQHQREQAHSTEETEKQFWEIVNSRTRHIAVHAGHVDTKTQNCTLFPTKKENQYSKHPWNLNLLPQHSLSLLRYLGPVPGVTVPTLHVGMLYTASCWSTDIHHLPYVQYLHGETDIVWYAVPSQEEAKFKSVMKEIIPTLVSNSPRWLKEDTAMVPPEILLQKGIHLSRCVQSPHQFVVVFPRCYTAAISCGYTLAESAHFAMKEWIQLGFQTAETLQMCQEPELFSMDELICQIMEDTASPPDLLKLSIPAFEQIIHRELSHRKLLSEHGVTQSKRMATPTNTRLSQSASRRASIDAEESTTRCEITKKICYLSLLLNTATDQTYSLEQGVVQAQKKKKFRLCILYYRHSEEELKKTLEDAKARLSNMSSPEAAPIQRRKSRKSET
ncbi:protein Jumonji-like isoform X2 [Ostrea edulis]|nr:protein Jumonji-like isoform X2 [Ostrea edulis]